MAAADPKLEYQLESAKAETNRDLDAQQSRASLMMLRRLSEEEAEGELLPRMLAARALDLAPRLGHLHV